MKRTKRIPVACCLLILGIAIIAGPAEGKKRILVFGDSNTFGYVENARGVVSRLPLHTAWPGKMAELLGTDYEVVVEGLSGRTTKYEQSGTLSDSETQGTTADKETTMNEVTEVFSRGGANTAYAQYFVGNSYLNMLSTEGVSSAT